MASQKHPSASPISSQHAIEEARLRRQSVVELERMLWQGRTLQEYGGSDEMARRLGLTPHDANRAMRLAEAESRGLLATATPMTLSDAEIAAGI